MAGYGMNDPNAAKAINALAAKNNAAAAKAGPAVQTTYKPGELQDLWSGNFQTLFPGSSLLGAGDKSKLNMLQYGASYMPSVNPTAQTTGAGVGIPWASGMVDWIRQGYENAGVDTSSIPLWGGGKYVSKNSPSSGIGAPSGGGLAAGGGGLGSLGALMGGGGLGSLGSMMGGGGLGSLGSILGGGGLGGAMGGGSGAPQQPAAAEKESDKPVPQRYWAGGYTAAQQAAMNQTGDNYARERMKAGFDADNIKSFKGMQGYDDLKADRVKQAQQLAERQGGQYDTEGNYYSRDVLGGVIADENKKRAQQDVNYYDTPSGAVPVAGNANDNTPAASGGGGGGGTSSSGGTKSGGTKSGGSLWGGGGLSGDWLKKLGSMASSWFGGF